jgi:hypothetical protein
LHGDDDQWVTLLLRIVEMSDRFSVRRPAFLTEFICDLPQSLRANAGIVTEIMPRPLPASSFPIHYSLIILIVDAVYSELLTASLNTPQVNKINNLTLHCLCTCAMLLYATH